MLEGRGNAQNIVCPLHRWTYDLKGELLGAPHFPENPCVKLHSTPLTQLARPAVRRAARPAQGPGRHDRRSGDCDFSGYVLDRVRSTSTTSTGRPSSRSTSRSTTSSRSTRAWAISPTATTSPWDYGPDWSVQIVQAQGRAGAARHAGVPQVARGLPEAARRPHAQAGRAVDDLLPRPDARVVPERAGGSRPAPALADAHHQRGRVLLPRGDRALRARVHRGAAGGLHRDRARGRRDLPAHGPRPPRAVGSRAWTTPAPTSRRWKTPWCTSTNGCGGASRRN